MFQAHCRMEWMVLTVLSLCLPVWSALKVVQPYRVISTNGTARVQCHLQPRPSFNQIQLLHDQSQTYPYPAPEELGVTLLKGLHGNQELCSSILNLTEHRETGVETEVQCFAQLREGTVEVTILGLKAPDTDVYRCEIAIFYPPPYLRLIGNGTLIHVIDNPDCPVQGAHIEFAHQSDEEENDESNKMMGPFSVPVAVLMILVILVLIIIIFLQILQCDRGRREIFTTVSDEFHKVDAAKFPC